jgi:hypothetical protein
MNEDEMNRAAQAIFDKLTHDEVRFLRAALEDAWPQQLVAILFAALGILVGCLFTTLGFSLGWFA